MKSVETRTALIELLEDKFVKISFKGNVIVSDSDSLENYNAYSKLLSGKKGVFLIVFPPLVSSSPAGRESFKSPQRISAKIAEAIIIKNFGQDFELRDFQHKAKLPYPQKAFKDETKAIEWLKTFL